MEEKFYYSRWFVWSIIVSSLPVLSVGFVILYCMFIRLGAYQWSNEKWGWFVAMVFFSISAISIIGGLVRFRRAIKPAIVMTNKKAVFYPLSIKPKRNPYFLNLRRLELGFEQIVSATMTEMPSVYSFEKPREVVEVKFRRPSGVEDSFCIFTNKVAKKDRLVEILKQHIKFDKAEEEIQHIKSSKAEEEILEEKFYYSKAALKSGVVPYILLALVSFFYFLDILKKEKPIWWMIFVVPCCIAALDFLIRIFVLRKRPILVVTERTMAYMSPNSYTFNKRVLDFDQIISASVIDAGKAIEITYNKSNNKQGFLAIKHFYVIQDYKKAIDILKQRIKFE